MDTQKTIERFSRVYLGDSLLVSIRILTAEAVCTLEFNSGKLLSSEAPDIFHPEKVFSPAVLELKGVRSFHVEEGWYQLNSTVVDFSATPAPTEGYIFFSFTLTGGTDPGSFMKTLRVLAKDFSLGVPTQT